MSFNYVTWRGRGRRAWETKVFHSNVINSMYFTIFWWIFVASFKHSPQWVWMDLSYSNEIACGIENWAIICRVELESPLRYFVLNRFQFHQTESSTHKTEIWLMDQSISFSSRSVRGKEAFNPHRIYQLAQIAEHQKHVESLNWCSAFFHQPSLKYQSKSVDVCRRNS